MATFSTPSEPEWFRPKGRVRKRTSRVPRDNHASSEGVGVEEFNNVTTRTVMAAKAAIHGEH